MTENGTIFDGSVRIPWYPKWRFQKSPLRWVFLKRCVFGDRSHRIRVNGRLNQRKNLRSQTKTDKFGRCAVPKKELWNGCYSPEQTTCPFYYFFLPDSKNECTVLFFRNGMNTWKNLSGAKRCLQKLRIIYKANLSFYLGRNWIYDVASTGKFNTITYQLCLEIDTSRPDSISLSFVKVLSFNRGNLVALYFCRSYYSNNKERR